MNDKTDKLSSFMDGELHNSEHLFERLATDTEMQEKWKRYHLIRDALKGQLSEHPSLDISAAVRESLKSEPVIFTPVWRRLSPRYILKQVAGLAVAAAVASIAVFSVQQTQLLSSENAVIATANSVTTSIQPDKIRQVSFTTRKKLDAAVESKLSGYLVNHNEYSNSTRVSGVMPYTRIVSFVSSTQAELNNNDK